MSAANICCTTAESRSARGTALVTSGIFAEPVHINVTGMVSSKMIPAVASNVSLRTTLADVRSSTCTLARIPGACVVARSRVASLYPVFRQSDPPSLRSGSHNDVAATKQTATQA